MNLFKTNLNTAISKAISKKALRYLTFKLVNILKYINNNKKKTVCKYV